MSLVTLSRVRRSYGGVRALDDVSLTAPEAQVLALLGPSGSGKSTILRLIAGLEPVDAGEIRIGDEVMSSSARAVATEERRVGMVFQDYSLFPHLTAGANVAFGLNKLGRAERETTALKWLDRVGLKHRAGSYPHELSGGEQQRVALARALAPAPRAVLLDEPFSGLDPVLRAELRDATLATLMEARTTTLFVTHDAEDALQVADRLAIMKAGKLLQESAPRQAYDAPTSIDAAAALGPINVFEGRVEHGAMATPFGAIKAAHLPEGACARAAVRAEALRLIPGDGARVLSVRPHGAHDVVRIGSGGVVWRALAPPRSALGETVSVEIQPAGAFAFSVSS
ncbi:MAG TPA: ABC transporter ATP-binding protein [Vitreimonas sp.]|uniref:ABC transporter ATP-binding protein n=1 Tax=Vitreimonas sp. TaxID=3069702 RepID=UPI002D318FD9|nr:ABC transporter ATP-binding protein [Vitreimonas sp.]HYD86117.1 ABC transporter ATP-binding protein [Vitreimonas sp.]